MLRWLFIIAWGMHGIGHIAGVTTAIWPKSGGFNLERPWILPGNVLVTGPVGKVWAVFWLAALILIVASAVGLFIGADWWRQLAVFGAVASLVAMVPWARTVPPGALLGVALDIGVLAMLLIPLSGLLATIEAR